jgi:hypothetical protein
MRIPLQMKREYWPVALTALNFHALAVPKPLNFLSH